MDVAGFATAHLVGNSLGGYVALLRLAQRGRAETVVALAPAGGWVDGDESYKERSRISRRRRSSSGTPRRTRTRSSPSPEGRRRATAFTTTNYEHIPPELLAHQIRGAASCDGAAPLIEYAFEHGWSFEGEPVTCPARIVWGTADQLLPLADRRGALPRSASHTPSGSSSTGSDTCRSSTSPPKLPI